MKISTIFGFILGFGIILLVVFSKEGTEYFLNWSAFGITVGGTIAATIIYFSPKALGSAILSFFAIFKGKQYYPKHMVDIIVQLSKEARNTSFINLVNSEYTNDVPFLKKGLILVADGMNSDEIRDRLTREKYSISGQNKLGERVFRIAGSFAPMFGMMGTVIGLIAMLRMVETPEEVPAAMGLALVTTLYGLILASLVFKPISGKIRDKNQTDTRNREILIEGILLIKISENPKKIEEKLLGYLN